MIVAAATLVALASAPAASAAPGDLDLGFGDAGTRSCGAGEGADLLLQNDGRIVMVGAAPDVGGGDTLVCRVTAAGALDPSFGGDGRVTTAVAPGVGDDRAGAVAQAWRGRILVAGVADASSGAGAAEQLFVARYMPDGTLDASFADDGVQTVSLPAERVLAVDLRGNGRITVAAHLGEPGVVVARFLYGGWVDRSFDGDGVRTVALPFTPAAAAFTRDGRLVIGGEAPVDLPFGSGSGFGAARLTADGGLDPAFGIGGVRTVALPEQADVAAPTGVALAPDGSVLLGGAAQTGADSDDTALVRLTPIGAPDPTFGFRGTVQSGIAPPSSAFIPPDDRALDVAVMPDGRVVASGFALNLVNGDSPSATVLRYRRDGTLDPTFGDAGVSLAPFPTADEVGIRSDGSLIVRSGTSLAHLLGDRADVALTGSVAVSAGPEIAVLEYSLSIRNDGPQAAAGVELTNFLPAGATSQHATATRGQCPSETLNRVARCLLGTMAPGERHTVTLRIFAPADAGTVVTRPSLSSATADTDIADNARRFTTTLPPPP